MSILIGMHKVETWADVSRIIERARSEQLYVLVSGIGVLVIGDKARALRTFRSCLLAYANTITEDPSIVSVIDPDEREAVGYAVNDRCCHYLYGVDPDEVMLEFADLAGRMQ